MEDKLLFLKRNLLSSGDFYLKANVFTPVFNLFQPILESSTSFKLDFRHAKMFVSQDTPSGWLYVSWNSFYGDELNTLLEDKVLFLKRNLLSSGDFYLKANVFTPVFNIFQPILESIFRLKLVITLNNGRQLSAI